MAEARTGRRSVLQILGPTAFLAVALAFGGWVVVDRWTGIVEAVGRLGRWSTLLSLLAAMLGVLSIFRAWFVIVRDMGVELTPRQALRVFGIGQIGKYLPGSVWSVLAPAQLVRTYGGSPRRMASATLVALGISVSVALAVGGALLPVTGGSLITWWYLPLAEIALLTILLPSVLNRIIQWGSTLLRRPVFEDAVSGKAILVSAIWAAVANVLFGTHIWTLAHALGADSLRAYLLCTCSYALAAAIGVLVFLAPAGAGAREGVLVLVLTASLTLSGAVAVALLSRVIMTVVEFGLALSQLLGQVRGR